MHLKMILATTELVLLIVGLITFVYSIYAMYNDTNGAALVKAHQFMLYCNLGVQVVQLAVAGLLVYKV